MWKNIKKLKLSKKHKTDSNTSTPTVSSSSSQQSLDHGALAVPGPEARRHSASPTSEPDTRIPTLGTTSNTVPATRMANLDSINAKDNYGIKVLYDSASANIDFVLIHGLTGSAYTTWLDKQCGIHWARDLLGGDFIDARIMTYGYDVDVVNFWKHAAKDGIEPRR